MKTYAFVVSVLSLSCLYATAGCDFISTTDTSSAPSTQVTPTPTVRPTPKLPTPTPRLPTPTPTPTPTPVITVATEVGLTTSMSIGRTGGLVQSAGHGASVFVPAGALTNANIVTVAAQDTATFPAPAMLASHVYDIGPTGLAIGASVSITLAVIGTIPTGMHPVLAYLNTQNAWQVVPNSTFNSRTKTVTGVVTHFTNFAVLEIPVDGAECAQSPDPNAYCSPSTCDLEANICHVTTGGVQYYTVGGTLQGLGSDPITIVLNSKHSVTLHTDGNFLIPDFIPEGGAYVVTVPSQPNNTSCTVTGSTGLVGNANVTSVAVACLPTLALCGTVTGLGIGSLVTLQNGNNRVAVHGVAAPFAFPRILSGENYNVTIATQPAAQVCTVAAGAGVASQTDIALVVSCRDLSFRLGGTITGLVPKTYVALANGNDIMTVGNGNYVFASIVHGGNDYNVSIMPPAGQSCAFEGVTPGQGTMPEAPVYTLDISCVPLTYSLSGTVTGLTGNTNLVLNNANVTQRVGNGAYAFSQVAYASVANVTVSPPPGQTCRFGNGTFVYRATVGAAAIAGVDITCTMNTYSVGGTVTGLVAQASVTLLNANDRSIIGNGTFILPRRLTYGAGYDVSILSPVGQTCSFDTGQSGVGTVGTADVTDLNIICTPLTFALGGTVSGVVANANVTLSFGNQNVSLNHGGWVFPLPIAYNTRYTVVLTSPAYQSCSFSPPSSSLGTIRLGDVNNVNVTCTPHPFSLGGNISGLIATSTVVLASGNDTVAFGNGSYRFPTSVGYSHGYIVALRSPPNHSCAFSPTDSNVGVMGGANVADVNVVCTPAAFVLGGRVSGLLTNTNVTLMHASDSIDASNGVYAFPALVRYGTPYLLSITPPPGQACVFWPASAAFGTMPAASVNANVSCSQRKYTIGGTVSGLTGIVRLTNGDDAIRVSTNGIFTMPASKTYQTSYNVGISSQPNHQLCAVTQGSGIVGAANVTTVLVSCGPAYMPSGNVPVPDMNGVALQGRRHLTFATEQNAVRVIGQKDFVSSDRAAGQAHLSKPYAQHFAGRTPGCTQVALNMPQGASVTPRDALLVADTANNRVVVWHTMPEEAGQRADLVLGQPDFTTCTQPGNNASSSTTLSEPSDVWSDGTHVLVADTAAARVLVWHTFPLVNGQAADAVLGQSDFTSNNAGAGSASVGAPTGVTSDGYSIFVAEYEYSRVTQWSGVSWQGQTSSLTAILGQPDAFATACNAGGPRPGAHTLCHPRGVAIVGTQLVVDDSDNNRTLAFQSH